MNDGYKKSAENHYQGMIKLISSLKFLAQQNLPIRGHDDLEGNLRQLLELRAHDSLIVKEFLQNNKYLSHDIINELIELMAREVTTELLSEIRERKYFSTIVDETRDITGIEQMSFCTRSVDDDYSIYEDFLGFKALTETTSKHIFEQIKDILIRFCFDKDNLRGQTYDGASNMSGHISGVAALFLEIVEEALYVHCYAHRLNLCLQEVSKKVTIMNDAQEFVKSLHNFINNAPKRLQMFKDIKDKLLYEDSDSELKISSKGIKPMCVTRFTVRTEAYAAVIDNYFVIMKVLTACSEAKDDTSAKASGLLDKLLNFKVIFGLHLARDVFAMGESLSVTLQSKDLDAQIASNSLSSFDKFLNDLRNDKSFEDFYAKCKIFSTKQNADPPLVPRRLRFYFEDAEKFFRKEYFEVVDVLLNELRRRFDGKSLHKLSLLQSVLIDSSNGKFDEKKASELAKYWPKDVKKDKLIPQLKLFSTLKDIYNSITESEIKVREVTSMSTLVDLMNDVKGSKITFSEIHTLMKLYFVVPFTSCTSERSFSVLRMVKTYIRSSMTQLRLNNLVLLHVYKEKTKALSEEKIAKLFINSKSIETRTRYFGKRA